MAPLVALSLALVPALVPTVTADLTPGCHTLLQDVAAQGHSDFELLAYCRANMPPQLCRDAVSSLGSQPWSPDRIALSCQKWEEQWSAQAAAAPGRSVYDFSEVQSRADAIIKVKSEAGLCKDPKTGGQIPLDKCITWKSKVYSEKTKELHDLLSNFYGAAMGAGKIQESEQLGPIAAPGGARMGMFAGLALIMLSFAGAAAMTVNRVWRRVRKPEHAHQLVDSSPDTATPSDA
mmetsp:Transcript_3955/g.7990  ORF Transcript_3955/g.7990 Transcript_3955/m.7990 type:complete len:234 (-) Transcript_3955:71-772(-)